MIECPRLIFPYLRRIVSDVTRDGGYPPLNLEQVDFLSLYRAELARRQAKARRRPDAGGGLRREYFRQEDGAGARDGGTALEPAPTGVVRCGVHVYLNHLETFGHGSASPVRSVVVARDAQGACPPSGSGATVWSRIDRVATGEKLLAPNTGSATWAPTSKTRL